MPVVGQAPLEWLLRRRTRHAASSGARSFERGWEIEVATGFKKRCSILAPADLIEIDDKKEAGFVLKQRVDASDEGLSRCVAT